MLATAMKSIFRLDAKVVILSFRSIVLLVCLCRSSNLTFIEVHGKASSRRIHPMIEYHLSELPITNLVVIFVHIFLDFNSSCILG